jgi:hypothetical protein
MKWQTGRRRASLLPIAMSKPKLLDRYNLAASHSNQTKAKSYANCRNPVNDNLMVRREEKSVGEPNLKHGVLRSRRTVSIDPTLKAWIDNVIVPALADQWAAHRASRTVHV